MQRRKDRVPFQARQHFPIDDNGAVIFRTAMNDAMANGNKFDRICYAQPVCLRPQ